jgi:hypothetical protein
MTTSAARARRLPRSELAAIGLVALGVLLWMFVSRGLLVVAGVGAFGPGILRELGWLKDHDEFQAAVARRAGLHAYLVGGLGSLVVLSGIEWSGGTVDDSAEWLRLVVILLWLTWLASTLLSYWGARKMAGGVLLAFGSFWAVFAVASVIGEWGTASLVETLLGIGVATGLVAPFFGLAWTARRWPRPTGIALIGVAAIFVVVFSAPGRLPWSTVVMTAVMLVGPLIVAGVALIHEAKLEAGA